jgi:hypothetical protein
VLEENAVPIREWGWPAGKADGVQLADAMFTDSIVRVLFWFF